MAAQQAAPTHAPTTGSFWNSFGGFLSDGVAAYGQFEAIKARKNSTGQGRLEHTAIPELNNAATQVEAPKTLPSSAAQKETMVFGIPQKTLLFGFGGLLALGLVLKAVK